MYWQGHIGHSQQVETGNRRPAAGVRSRLWIRDYGPDKQTLQIDCFCNPDASPPMSVHNLSALIWNALWQVGDCRNRKMVFAGKLGSTKCCPGLPEVLTVWVIYRHGSAPLPPLIQEWTVAMLPGRQDGKSGNVGPLLQKQNGHYAHLPPLYKYSIKKIKFCFLFDDAFHAI